MEIEVISGESSQIDAVMPLTRFDDRQRHIQAVKKTDLYRRLAALGRHKMLL